MILHKILGAEIITSSVCCAGIIRHCIILLVVSFNCQKIGLLFFSVERRENYERRCRSACTFCFYITKTATYTRDIISNAPAIKYYEQTQCFCVCFITSSTIEYVLIYKLRQHIFNVFRMYFTTMQLLRHVNAVVNMRL